MATEQFGFCLPLSEHFERALDYFAGQVVRLGFDAVDYAFMPRVRTPEGGWNAPDIASRNFPPRWKRGWSRYSRDDPYLWSCYDRNLPLDWDEVKDATWPNAVQREAISYIDGLGFLDGITVPIHVGGGGFAFVSAVSHERRGVWRADRQAATERLFVLAHGFHGAVSAHFMGLSSAGAGLLSRREREVLGYAADGLSARETAMAMGRSPETVRRQRKSAMSKLGARTIAQAVAQAAGS